MNMIPAKHQVAAFGYDNLSKTLRVEFTTGDTYDYRAVPIETFGFLTHSNSADSAFQSHVRGKFEYTKVGVAA